MSAKHYEKARITPQMVGMVLDVALLCHVASTPAMGLQAAKKIIYTKRNSGKTRIQELQEAIVAIKKLIEFEELDSMTKGWRGFPEIETVGARPEKYLDVKPEYSASGNRCRGCILRNEYGCFTTGAMQMAKNVTGTKCTDGFIYVLKDAE